MLVASLLDRWYGVQELKSICLLAPDRMAFQPDFVTFQHVPLPGKTWTLGIMEPMRPTSSFRVQCFFIRICAGLPACFEGSIRLYLCSFSLSRFLAISALAKMCTQDNVFLGSS
jgi:hypothetical protein